MMSGRVNLALARVNLALAHLIVSGTGWTRDYSADSNAVTDTCVGYSVVTDTCSPVHARNRPRCLCSTLRRLRRHWRPAVVLPAAPHHQPAGAKARPPPRPPPMAPRPSRARSCVSWRHTRQHQASRFRV